ncbi:D-inositol-3-phosphate glycosyltransferase [Austwickia sp. TVS 96-490-7B]|uniref:glycosyltransferase family 4 protein n=1 Tax=Austwickia sp. TVS 96-490-7B TaxID=2830843 RepID=UPI001C55E28E|nr:glycosyltransferase family 4 protein [Austwickia sp. TVS 96-490-7B]MBW3084135.1 D-inositol-3-phosphate glycosyltransferase [Austwickia sp. TVS 96-490-7B]
MGTPNQRVVVAVHPGAERYGSDRMFVESVRGLLAAGCHVIAVLPGPGPLCADLTDAGADVDFAPLPVLRKSALKPAGLATLIADTVRSARHTRDLLRRHRPDAVYVSTLTIPTWIAAARLHRTRVVCHVHEAEPHAPRPVRLGLASPLMLADSLILNSAFAGTVLTDTLPALASRITVVPNGVAGPPHEPTPPRTTLDGPIRVVFVGRLSPRKGPDIALAAVRRLRDQGHDIRLTLIGSVFTGYEWFEDQLRRDAATDIADGTLTMRGFTDDIWSELAHADIALVPSVMPEPFGNAAVEAILARRPVVASRIGGLVEAVAGADSAALATAGDPDDLARAIDDLISRWPTIAAATDAACAHARHAFAPQRYRHTVATIVTARPTSPAEETDS